MGQRKVFNRMEEIHQSEDGRKSISASPDFAQVYIFIQTFGALLKLPPVTLVSLENFLLQGCRVEDSHLTLIHWRLLNTTYRAARTEWQRTAVKCARRHGLCAQNISYDELSAQVRLRLFRLCCEDQFDYNLAFKNELKREEMGSSLSRPLVGCDSTGQKYWLLKDSVFDIRLYGESHYDVEPPKRGKWVELARSLDGLAEYIAELESTRVSNPASQSHDTHVTSDRPGREEKKSRSQNASKKSSTKKPSPLWDGDQSIEGCIKCRKDINYSQMLLCDECDRECHTYCQYPRLWTVPRGKWICPICKEGHLIEELKRVYTDMSTAKASHERTMERKQKSIARLQRTGLLLQNIILEEGEDAGRRPRRSRKEINYAELNDIPLPPLGRRDYVGSDWSPPRVSSRKRFREEYIQEDYLAPRIRSTTRRFRGSPVAEPQSVENDYNSDPSSEEDQPIDVGRDNIDTGSANSKETYESFGDEESTPPAEFQSNGHHSSSDSELDVNLVTTTNLMYRESELSDCESPATPLSLPSSTIPQPIHTSLFLQEPGNAVKTGAPTAVALAEDSDLNNSSTGELR